MTITASQLRSAIRDTRYRGCIATAAFYLKDLAAVTGKAEAAMMFGHATWRKALRAASQTFVMHSPNFGFEIETKAASEDSDKLGSAIAEVTSRVTTVDKDLDGDVVHPEGLVFDPRGPLLWMHLQNQPMGTLREVVSQDKSAARCKFAVANTTLGRDSLELFKIGALRKSIGFRVLEAEPLGFVDGANGKQVPTGFDIKRALVLETSAVAVPANPNTGVERLYAKEYDAVRTLAGRKVFESPLIQKWAGSIYENRMKVFSGATLEGRPEIKQTLTELTEAVKAMSTVVATKAVELEAGQESAGVDLEAKMMAWGMDEYADGSYEQAQDGVQKCVKKYLMDKGQVSSDHYPMLMATYGDKAAVCMRKWGEDGMERKCYEVGYKMDGGRCEITSHKSIKVQPSIVEMAEKMLGESVKTKAFTPGGGTQAGDAEEFVLDTAGGGKKQIQDSVSEDKQLRALLAKAITGEIETDDSLRELIAQAAGYFEKASRLDGLLGLVEAGA